MSYKHLTTFERSRIEILHKEGYSCRQIAEIIGRHHSTVSRELARNSHNNSYDAESAHEQYLQRRKNSFYKGKFSFFLIKLLYYYLCLNWSPEQICHTVAKGRISTKTVYNWIYNGKIPFEPERLRHKAKRRSKETRGKFKTGRSIQKRPKSIKYRVMFGHWELDTIVSSRGKSKACFATFLERQTRFYVAIKMKDRTATSMKEAIEKLAKVLPLKARKSFTTDRGKEFACYEEVEKELKTLIFFADPYAAWQRGSNENSNGLLREYYPKKTDLGKVTEEDLIEKLILLNTRPRKCLNWETPFKLFLDKLKCCT